MKYFVRRATLADIDEIVALEKRAWPDNLYGEKEKFFSRISLFPEGVSVAIQAGKIVGVVVAQIMKYDFSNPPKTWYEATDNGFLTKTLDTNGNVVFGVDLSVSPDARSSGIATRLVQEIGVLAISRNIEFGVLGGRLPGYHKFPDLPIEKYLALKTETGQLFDPELRFYVNAGIGIGKVLPNYFKDPQSRDYGIQLIWRNPLYIPNVFIGKLLGRAIARVIRLWPQILSNIS